MCTNSNVAQYHKKNSKSEKKGKNIRTSDTHTCKDTCKRGRINKEENKTKQKNMDDIFFEFGGQYFDSYFFYG